MKKEAIITLPNPHLRQKSQRVHVVSDETRLPAQASLQTGRNRALRPQNSMQSTSPLVFLGLDGLPWSLARELSAQGLLPNLTQVMDTSGPIRAELPELSPVNWTSLFTASPPGVHGVYGFTRMDP